jgi:Mannosyl-glycoprotein endo-beta-N-acetylglucosaminidase
MPLGVHGIGLNPAPDIGGSERVARPASNGEGSNFRALLGRAVNGTPSAAAVQQVMASRTPLSGTQASEAIRSAYSQVVGEPPSQGTLAILTSQWALETGQGKSMYNYNFAGIKGRGPEGMTAVMSTREGYGASAVQIRDGFRAYTSAEAGAKDYVSLLQRKYGAALEAAKAEQPERFAQELKVAGYYTGDPVLYAKGVTQLANRAMEYGFDALGTNSGALAARPTPMQPYFAPSGSAFLGNAPYRPELGNNPFESLGLAMNGSFEPTASADAVRDEMSRMALMIAAQRGAV